MECLSNRIVEFYELLSSWEQEVIKDSDLSLQQMHTIEVIGNNEMIQMKSLADKLHISMGTLTVMIYRLEKMSLVKREKNPEDGRSFIIRLTEKGELHFKEHHNHHATLISELLFDFNDDEKKTLNNLIEKMIINF